ncbi:MAG: dienelactone hydrolase family protein [Candidatus Polarisedimenticolia bacterium]
MTSYDVAIPSGEEILPGDLSVPQDAHGLVVFAHGSGSSRQSPRNQYVAGMIQSTGLATLLFDLLTADEERMDLLTATHRFDIALLSTRLEDATTWILNDPDLKGLPLGYFGSSTGAAAALVAAASIGPEVGAVVSRGGRPDLAGESLSRVTAPTLLIVGEHDTSVLKINEEVLRQLAGTRELAIVPGATHLFDERGALGLVGRLASRWFVQHLGEAR